MARKAQTSAGPRKAHGPKKNMFHCWTSTSRLHLGEAGVLGKYYNREAWTQACFARGKKTTTDEDWFNFYRLKTKAQKNDWLKSLKG